MHALLARLVLLTLLFTPCWVDALAHTTPAPKKPSLTILIAEERLSHGKLLPTSEYLLKLFAYLERESGVQILQKRVPWNRAMMMAVNGEGVIFGASKTPERMEKLRYSVPLMEEYVWAVYSAQDTSKIESVEDLSRFTVAIPYGVTYGLEFEKAKKEKFKHVITYDNLSEQLRSLSRKPNLVLLFGLRDFKEGKDVVAFFHEKMLPKYAAPGTEHLSFRLSTQALFIDTLHFATAKNKHIAEMEKIDEAIRKGLKSGEITKILQLRK